MNVFVTLDTMAKSGYWYEKQTITVEEKITPGNRGTVNRKVRFNSAYHHYWNFQFTLKGERYSMWKNNSMSNVYELDAGTMITFCLRYYKPDEIYLHIVMN